MKLKDRLRYTICELGHRPWVAKLARLPGIQRVVSALPGGKALYRTGWERLHPFDRQHGIDTSGADRIDPQLANEAAFAHAHSYGGSQPGLVRAALAMLQRLETATFVDLGCGKGRPLFVATEFPFRDIVGVEFSPRFVEIARENAAAMAERYPERTRVRIEQGDAGAYVFPPGDIVLFLYNPFGEVIMRQVVAQLEAAMVAEPRRVYVIYYNPGFGQIFDSSPALQRHFTQTIPHAPDEQGFAPSSEDTLTIWRGGTA